MRRQFVSRKASNTMMQPSARLSIARRAAAAAVGLALVVTLGACSSSAKPGAGATTTGPASVKATAALLQKALQEQVAGNLTQAQTDYMQVIVQDPKNKYAYYDLGLIYQTQGKGSDAESQYRLALTLDTKFGPALYNLAILRTSDNDITGAVDLYRQAIAANAKDANAHFNLGLLLRQTHQPGGNAEIQTAVNLEPSLAAKATAQGVPLTGH